MFLIFPSGIEFDLLSYSSEWAESFIKQCNSSFFPSVKYAGMIEIAQQIKTKAIIAAAAFIPANEIIYPNLID